ncbi:hypothetical protein ASF73_20690 [Xanthomonas sp. Leaf131]|nr:hypothetical protein ASF73_20690 [Xanthomonas sp. Leaf131]
MRKGSISAALMLSMTLCCSAIAQDLPNRAADGSLRANGKPLYTFDTDTTPSKSSCNGPCAIVWPPYLASATAAPSAGYRVIIRDDGRQQWALNGKPLYFYASDQGDQPRGDGVNGTWHLAR